MKAPTANRLVRPGVQVWVRRHPRDCAGDVFVEEGYRAVVLGPVTNTRRRGDWWYVREDRTGNVRCAISGWCRVLRRKGVRP